MDTCYLNTSVLKYNPNLEDPTYGCDAIILDLEDGVHISKKEEARAQLRTIDLSPIDQCTTIGIRINTIQSIEGIRDLDTIFSLLKDQHINIDFVQIPKVEAIEDILLFRNIYKEILPKVKVIPIVETPKGMDAVNQIASVSDAMMFGQVDMEASLYGQNEAYLAYQRGKFCAACANHRIPAIDTAAIRNEESIRDLDTFAEACTKSKKEGFIAKAVVNPKQIPIVKRVFDRYQNDLEKYTKTINAYENSEIGFSILEKEIIAPPFVAKAKMMLELYSDTVRTN